MDKLIRQAKQYIKDNNGLVEIKELTKWKSQGIIKGIRKVAFSSFMFDKYVIFADDTYETIWV